MRWWRCWRAGFRRSSWSRAAPAPWSVVTTAGSWGSIRRAGGSRWTTAAARRPSRCAPRPENAGAAPWRQATGHSRRALRFAAADPDVLNTLAVALTRARPPRRAEAERLARRAVAIGGTRDSVYRTTLDDVLDGR